MTQAKFTPLPRHPPTHCPPPPHPPPPPEKKNHNYFRPVLCVLLDFRQAARASKQERIILQLIRIQAKFLTPSPPSPLPATHPHIVLPLPPPLKKQLFPSGLVCIARFPAGGKDVKARTYYIIADNDAGCIPPNPFPLLLPTHTVHRFPPPHPPKRRKKS